MPDEAIILCMEREKKVRAQELVCVRKRVCVVCERRQSVGAYLWVYK